jgi:hypothetical protein
MRADPKMGRVAAGRVVAGVQDKHPLRDRTLMGEFIGETMG